jgi:DNA-binding response OmpR family regulator
MSRNNENQISILIVDDEIDIREILQFNLEFEGYHVDLASSAEEALKILSPAHNLILLDVMMGGMSGFKMADALRKSGNEIPIIFLTAKNTENDMLTGFSIGGDDYISKPFSIKEVVARVRTVLRRSKGPASDKASTAANKYMYEGLIVNLDLKNVSIDNEPIDLTKTEFDMLSLFVKYEERIFTREEILNKIWKNQAVVERTVDVHIARLRKKMGVYGKCIVNRSGYGYVFIAKENTNPEK